MDVHQPRCPHCGSFGRPSTYFCVVCGGRYHGPISGDVLALAARRQDAMLRPVRCRHCDVLARAGARFCAGCGASLVFASNWNPANG